MSITSPYRTHYIRYSCLLFVSFIMSLITCKFPVGIIFIICLTARQTEYKHSLTPLHMCGSWQIQSQSTLKWKTCLHIPVPICVQNIIFNLTKLFLDHKLIRWTDRLSDMNQLLNVIRDVIAPCHKYYIDSIRYF